MGRYRDMIQANYSKVRGDEKIMYGSVDIIDDMLEEMKEHHPDKYWEVMRSTHELIYGKHFDKEYAEWEVAQMHHKGDDGKVYKGEHWSREDTNAVMASVRGKLPASANEFDFYVALNSQWHDYICWAMKHFESEEDAEAAIIEGAIAFWFKDEDWPANDKAWEYFRIKSRKYHENK